MSNKVYRIIHGDCLLNLGAVKDSFVDLVYIDPPFNHGHTQKRMYVKTTESESGSRVGFGGKRYDTIDTENHNSFEDTFEDYIAFLRPIVRELHRVLKPTGSFFLHLDSRESHYAKIMCDEIFGRPNFMNEIIWSYDYGAKPKKRWPSKHDNIFWYVKDIQNYTFNYDCIDRIPYMAPGLCGPEKAARGKIPTDVWQMTIVPTNSKEKQGYPTQKPEKLVSRIIAVHSNPGDVVLDCFAGSGTTGACAIKLKRAAIMIDSNPQAIKVMTKRFEEIGDKCRTS